MVHFMLKTDKTRNEILKFISMWNVFFRFIWILGEKKTNPQIDYVNNARVSFKS